MITIKAKRYKGLLIDINTMKCYVIVNYRQMPRYGYYLLQKLSSDKWICRRSLVLTSWKEDLTHLSSIKRLNLYKTLLSNASDDKDLSLYINELFSE